MAPKPNPPFLLLRGLIREQRHWGEFIPTLQQHFPSTRIVALDLPGNGVRYQASSPSTIAGMTEALRKQWAALGYDETPINLLALSMGGMIALDWMTRYPAEIAAGVLINTSIKGYAPFYWRLRWQNYLKFLKMLTQTPAQREQAVLALTSNQHASNAPLLLDWQHWQRECPVSGRNAIRQMRACARFKLPQKPPQPILILNALADQLVDYRCSLNLRQAWQADWAQHPSAGHDLPLDDPLWTCLAIQAWLSGKLLKIP